jgi:hypothetical protein
MIIISATSGSAGSKAFGGGANSGANTCRRFRSTTFAADLIFYNEGTKFNH